MTTTRLGDYFTKNPRGTDSLTDDAPEWLREAIYEAHDGKLPDDWTYAVCRSFCDFYDETDGPEWDDVAERIHEFADGDVPIYTHELTAWLASDVRHADIVDDAVSEYGSDDMDTVRRIMLGYYSEVSRIAHVLSAHIADANV